MTESASNRPVRVLLWFLVVVLATIAWVSRWVLDDAYITFRYSENLVAGLGAVWNAGYAVEGYTNFLWMLLMAGGLRLGFAPEGMSAVFGVGCFIGSLLLSFRLARRVLDSDAWALMATTIVGTNYSFLMYSTGGLETSMNAMLTVAALVLCVEALDTATLTVPRATLASVVIGLLVMTRPDSALIGGLTGLCLLWVIFQSKRIPGRGAVLLALVAPACVIVGPWLAWKYALYGRLLPNTFYAKVGTQRRGTWLRGVAYVAWLFVSYWWLPVTLCVIGVARARGVSLRTVFAARKPALFLVTYVAAWLAYVVSIGGDIFEFRHLVAAIPALVILMVSLFSRALPTARSAVPVLACLLVGSAVHGAFFEYYVRPDGIFPIHVLREMGSPDENLNWKAIGVALEDALDRDPSVTIAVSPAGAIPYFSRARTIDMLGLNDLWVPAHGYDRRLCRLCSGHARLATMAYLMDSDVNLLIGQPLLASFSHPAEDPEAIVRSMCYQENLDYGNLPADMTLLRVRLHDDVAVVVAYLKPHPRVDHLVSEGRWMAQPVSRARLVEGTTGAINIVETP